MIKTGHLFGTPEIPYDRIEKLNPICGLKFTPFSRIDDDIHCIDTYQAAARRTGIKRHASGWKGCIQLIRKRSNKNPRGVRVVFIDRTKWSVRVWPYVPYQGKQARNSDCFAAVNWYIGIIRFPITRTPDQIIY